MLVATNWATVASFATALGTLVLALATFASIRSANRSARIAEAAFEARLRPVLVTSRLDDPVQKIRWMDNHWAVLQGAQGIVQLVDGNIYLAISLRNVGSGLAVAQGWAVVPHIADAVTPHLEPDQFRRQTRDLYIAPNDIGFWQGALRDPSDELFAAIATKIRARQGVAIDLLYFNAEGGQQTVSRFQVVPVAEDAWISTVGRHFSLDHDLPR